MSGNRVPATALPEFIEDFALVRSQVPQGSFPTRAVLRNIVAPFLRKWLCDYGIRDADAAAGKSLMISALVNQSVLRYCEQDKAIFWHAEVPLGGISVGGGAPLNHIAAPFPTSRSQEVQLSLNHFIIQKVGYRKIGTERSAHCFVKRCDAVRFFCDKRAGAHTHAQAKVSTSRSTIEALEREIGVDLDGRSILFASQLDNVNLADEGIKVYTFLHSITLDTFERFASAWEVR